MIKIYVTVKKTLLSNHARHLSIIFYGKGNLIRDAYGKFFGHTNFDPNVDR